MNWKNIYIFSSIKSYFKQSREYWAWPRFLQKHFLFTSISLIILFNQYFIIICALLLREINSVVESSPSFKLPPVEQQLKIFPGTFMLWFPSNCYIMINTWLFTFPLEMTNKEYWDISNNCRLVMIDYVGVSAWMIIYFHWKENLAQRSKQGEKKHLLPEPPMNQKWPQLLLAIALDGSLGTKFFVFLFFIFLAEVFFFIFSNSWSFLAWSPVFNSPILIIQKMQSA